MSQLSTIEIFNKETIEMEKTPFSDTDTENSFVEPAGKFRIYLGAAAGVGKTVAMLEEGIRRKSRGADVVVGFVETHKRPFTLEKTLDFEIIPRKTISYRGSTFQEMDLDAILARAPEVVLVDELAHTNVPESSTNEKRYQDILILLKSGISVITTVNIQHLESIAAAVEEIVGAKVAERVPDWVVRNADQIELVDSSPESLRRRLLHGNIYPQEKIESALTHFFKFENLSALRDIALRFVADETEEEMLDYLRKIKIPGRWETSERIMVAVSGAPESSFVLHRAARMAQRAKTQLMVVHIKSADANLNGSDLDVLKNECEKLDARWQDLYEDDVAKGIVEFALSAKVTQIVLGATRQNKWKRRLGNSILTKIMDNAGNQGIDVHIIARHRDSPNGDFTLNELTES
ncbi:unnamed protein product [Acidithrix sp. C25]|nr:unnamed protein product [Acidithrix sp. C25]